MLANLHVKNLALIEEADINFKDGLNILTGETGAGKSIILGSVNLALGGKAVSDLIRSGADYALTELSFDIESEAVKEKLTAFGVEELEEGQLIISRKITPTRSQIKVNGQTYTLGQVREMASWLIDIHGQHDNQLLLNESHHIDILDAYAKESLAEVKAALKEVYAAYVKQKQELQALDTDEESRNREISFIEFEVSEIESAQLSEGEDTQLEADYQKMLHAQKIMEEMAVVEQNLVSGQDNVSDKLGQAVRALNSAAVYDDRLSGLCATLADVESLLSDAARMTADYVEDAAFDAETFQQVQQRLDFINSLKMKYGQTTAEILAYAESRKERLEQLQSHDELIAKLKRELAEKEKRLSGLSAQLSDLRKAAAQKLCAQIRAALQDLNFADVRFEAVFEQTGHFSANGTDNMYFVIAANPGEALKPLSKVASGGELSRIMLAIRTVTANQDDIGTLIFDEIDAGISGRTAQRVAEKLCTLSQKRQVICITHLPQIAAMADVHFMIEKAVQDNKTVTSGFWIRSAWKSWQGCLAAVPLRKRYVPMHRNCAIRRQLIKINNHKKPILDFQIRQILRLNS